MNNRIYRLPANKNPKSKEPVVSEKILQDAKKVLSKYKINEVKADE